MRGIDDEASLALATGSIGNLVRHFILRRLLPNILRILGVICILATYGAVFGWLSDSASDAWALACGAVLAAVAMILFLPGCFRSVFGRELLLGSWRCEVSASSAPDNLAGVQIKTFMGLGASEKKLRHSLYMHPDVAPYISNWLKDDATRKITI